MQKATISGYSTEEGRPVMYLKMVNFFKVIPGMQEAA